MCEPTDGPGQGQVADDRQHAQTARELVGERLGSGEGHRRVGVGLSRSRHLESGECHCGLQLGNPCDQRGRACAGPACLAALITVLQPVSAAFNPVVTLAERILGQVTTRRAVVLIVAQLIGGLAGAVLANLMFGLPPVTISDHQRTGGHITAVYWFTSSTSFANPAVTLTRTLSDTFAPGSVPMFVVMQLVGAGVGLGLITVLHPQTPADPPFLEASDGP